MTQRRSITDCLKHVEPKKPNGGGGTRLTYCASCNTLAAYDDAPPNKPCASCGGIVYGQLMGHWSATEKSLFNPNTWNVKGKWILLDRTVERIEFLFATKRNVKLDPTALKDSPLDFFNLDFSMKGKQK